MFINPKVAIEKGWITGIRNPDNQIQPNAIDFTLDIVKFVDSGSIAIVGEHTKKMRDFLEVSTHPGYRSEPFWELAGQSVYDGTSNVYVEVPEGVAAILWTRSTFARNGVLIASGLYDSGYRGQIGFTIYTHGGPVEIYQGTRIGQIGFIHSESAGLYAGGWNHQQGTHYTESASPMPSAVEQNKQAFPGPQLMEQAIGSNPNKSERAQELEDTHQWNSEQGGKPAGTKNFL